MQQPQQTSSYLFYIVARSPTTSCALPQAVELDVKLARKRGFWAHDKTHSTSYCTTYICALEAQTSKYGGTQSGATFVAGLNSTYLRVYEARRLLKVTGTVGYYNTCSSSV